VPRLSVWMIRTALVHLATGFALGALLLAQRGVAMDPLIPRLRPAHAELLLLGWSVQLAMGVAFWILPRFRSGAERGSERPAWLAYIVLNLGVVCSALSGTGFVWGGLQQLGRCAEAVAAAAFAVHAWPRVKPFR
jgi:heme/copper-type cytochrome/quinol oxidase subunit 1